MPNNLVDTQMVSSPMKVPNIRAGLSAIAGALVTTAINRISDSNKNAIG